MGSEGQRWPSDEVAPPSALRQRGGPFDAAEACRLLGISEQKLRAHRYGSRVSVLKDRWRYIYTEAALNDLRRGRNLAPARLSMADAAAQAQVTEEVLEDLISQGRLEVRQSKRTGTTWLSRVELRRLRAGGLEGLTCHGPTADSSAGSP
jgi:hypothetical protein